MISTQPFVAGSVFMSIIVTLRNASLLWGINRLQQCRDRTPTEALLVVLDVLLGLEQAQAGDVGELRLCPRNQYPGGRATVQAMNPFNV